MTSDELLIALRARIDERADQLDGGPLETAAAAASIEEIGASFGELNRDWNLALRHVGEGHGCQPAGSGISHCAVMVAVVAKYGQVAD